MTSIAKERPGGCFYSSSHIISKKQPAGSLPFVSHLILEPFVQALTLQLFPYIRPVPQSNGALAWFAIILFLPSHPLKDTSSFKYVCYLMRPPECNCHGNQYHKCKNVHFLELSVKPEKQLAELTVLRGSAQYLPGCSLEMSQTVLQYSKPQLYLKCGRNLQWNASKTPTTHSLLPPTASPAHSREAVRWDRSSSPSTVSGHLGHLLTPSPIPKLCVVWGIQGFGGLLPYKVLRIAVVHFWTITITGRGSLCLYFPQKMLAPSMNS